MPLNGPQQEELKEIILAVFNRRALVRALAEAEPSRDFETVVPAGSFEDEVFELITLAQQQGWVEHLFLLVRRRTRREDILERLRRLTQRDDELRYLKRLIDESKKKARRYSPLQGVAKLRPGAAVQLDDFDDDPHIARLIHARRRKATPHEPETQEFGDILTAFGEVKRAAVLGEPGAGKSTTLRRLAVDAAMRALDDAQALLPLLVELGGWRADEPLETFLAEQAEEIGWAIRDLSHAGRLIVLLDGLNEVPTAKRKKKAGETAAFLKELPPKTPVFVSCRKNDYTGELEMDLDTLALEPLTPPRIREALRRWETQGDGSNATADKLFWQLAGDKRLAGVLEKWRTAGLSEDDFWSDSYSAEDEWQEIGWPESGLRRRCVGNPRSLLRLAANPFMLTMLYAVWKAEGELPANRGELFADFVDSLLGRETGGALADTDRLLAGLAELAWRMQRDRIDAGLEGSDDLGVLTVLPRDGAVEALGEEHLLKKAEDASLLEGDDELCFRHQLLQEYFTARALESRIDSIDAAELWPRERWWERSGWEEACVLLAGLYSEDCTPVIEWLSEAQPEAAAQCIAESGAKLANEAETEPALRYAWLGRLTDLEREPAPEGRAAVGRALGRLGWDDRKGVGVRPDGLPYIDWVEIPGGSFLYQEGERREIETFWMARYPITNAQFQAFLDAEDGHANKRWWRGLAADADDRRPSQPQWSEANHPRETVSWYEAMAFCRWLSARLGYEIRLPTEQEWERAARGKEGREYPWGEGYRTGYANINETMGDAGPHYLGRTSAVWIYPRGASAEGVMDLAGNVWEWCLNEYERPENIQPGGTRPRARRGGSWVGHRGLARAAYRGSRYVPSLRDGLIGFRVVCSAPIL